MKKNIKGITLVALVMTIILLLILAGITISSIAGQDGLIEKATWSAFSTEMKGLDEQIKLKQTENSVNMLENQTVQEIFTVPVDVKKLPSSLKMEILYIRENMPEDKETTKEYYIESLLDYLVDDTGYVKGLYYIPKEISGNSTDYIYDELTKTAFKVKKTRIRGKIIHSYTYGCKVMGIENKKYLDVANM